jgi:response regulator RpfG family c-di-GMP phosphodiesterase
MQRDKAQNSAGASDRRSCVLVVDDEKGPRESLRMILSSRYRVLTADGGERALEILRAQPIDLVTTDLNMPGLKGDQLAGIMRDEFPETAIIIISGFATVDAAVGSIRQGVCDFLTKPFDVVQVTNAVSRALAEQQGRRRLLSFLEGIGHTIGRDRTSNGILGEFESNPNLQQRLLAVLDHSEAAQQTHRATTSDELDRPLDPQKIEFLERLADTIENRDPETRGHARRVSFYAGLIADSMKLSDTLREHTRIAAFLHDLGKLALANDGAHLDQLHSGLSQEPCTEHPAIGEDLLRSLGLPATIASALRHHHERWDGQGFPDGLRGDQNPLIARIIAVADSFDVLVRDRADSPNQRRQAALHEIQAGAGTRFDPQVVSVLCEISRVPARDLTTDSTAEPSEFRSDISERKSDIRRDHHLQKSRECKEDFAQ